MSGQVDALEIGVVVAISNCAHYLREEVGLSKAADQMEAVGAVVDKLIEAASDFKKKSDAYDNNEARIRAGRMRVAEDREFWRQLCIADSRLDAAIALCRGAK